MSVTVVAAVTISAVIGLLAYSLLWRRRQAQFIRQLLSNARPSRDRRVIASLSTLPDRIYNLEPTLRCLLKQTRPPDEIVLAVPEFSIRLQKEYVVPDYLEKIPHLRILRCKTDWGPATKFIPIVQEELAAGRGGTLVMVVDDDRIYPRDALETYLCYSRELPNAALCFRGAPMPRTLKWRVPQLCLASRIREPERVAVIMGC